ncbi:MAG: C4-dicarboxylate ABC transporter [Muribaculaceae bacterium]|nr:C4-dicarboxylate ABC transporter [Muribaculaceae bacterium]
MKRNSSVDRFLSPLEESTYQAFLTNELQVADIVEWILEQVGRSELIQTSFSISEEFLRRLFTISKQGKISKISLILDHKATLKTLKLWVFINALIENTYLADNHSKIILIKSEAGDKVSVITSQNLTRGNRAESSFVCTDPVVFDNLHSQIQDIINLKSVPLNEILSERIDSDRENGIDLSENI